VIALGLTLAGCNTLRPEPSRSTGSTHEYTKNYSLGANMRAYVGEPIVRFKDYHIQRTAVPYMTPVETFTLSVTERSLPFVKGQKYLVKGSIDFDNQPVSVVLAEDTPQNNYGPQHIGALVKEDGRVLNRVVSFLRNSPNPITLTPTVDVNPADARMTRVVEEKISATAGYQNYEIIYNGTDSKSIFLTYREYSPDGMARTAFYQNLTYDAKSQYIRFKQFKIQIHNATSEEIRFTVIEDGA